MSYFTSDISSKKFPLSQRVSAKSVRNGIRREILKTHPSFDDHCNISVSELQDFRQRYIQNLLANEVGVLAKLEDSMQSEFLNDLSRAGDAIETAGSITRGQRWADRIASFGGSWRFITIFAIFIFVWMAVNVSFLNQRSFDPYPFILLNLILSCLAAIQAPVIMMSQNRQEEKDRERAKNDYLINLKSESEIRMLHEKMDHIIIAQQENLLEIQRLQVDMMTDLMNRVKSGHAGGTSKT